LHQKKKPLYLHVFLYNAQQSLIFQAKAKISEKKEKKKGAQVCRKIIKPARDF
jgi:hypothetical protein